MSYQNIEFTEHSCCNCGVTFLITNQHNNLLRKNKKHFYCPNGHSQSYGGNTETEKLNEKLKAKQLEVNRYSRNYYDQIEKTKEVNKKLRELKKKNKNKNGIDKSSKSKG